VGVPSLRPQREGNGTPDERGVCARGHRCRSGPVPSTGARRSRADLLPPSSAATSVAQLRRRAGMVSPGEANGLHRFRVALIVGEPAMCSSATSAASRRRRFEAAAREFDIGEALRDRLVAWRRGHGHDDNFQRNEYQRNAIPQHASLADRCVLVALARSRRRRRDRAIVRTYLLHSAARLSVRSLRKRTRDARGGYFG
jgi:hypothetical protein